MQYIYYFKIIDIGNNLISALKDFTAETEEF